jgi:hypothetical protein
MKQGSASTGEAQQEVRACMHCGHHACIVRAWSGISKLPEGDEVDSGKHVGDV